MLHLLVARTIRSRKLSLALARTTMALTLREISSQAILSTLNHSMATELANDYFDPISTNASTMN